MNLEINLSVNSDENEDFQPGPLDFDLTEQSLFISIYH